MTGHKIKHSVYLLLLATVITLSLTATFWVSPSEVIASQEHEIEVQPFIYDYPEKFPFR